MLETYKQLKNERNFWFYLLSCIFSRIGDSIDVIAYSWIAYELTGSAVWLTLIIGVNALPTIFITPFIAPLIERFNKKRVMVITCLFRAAIVLITGTLMLLGVLTAPMLLMATLVISISESCADPAYMASIPQIIPAEKLDAGIALRTMVSQISQLIGSGLGGICIGLWGGGGALLTDGTLFALASLALATLKIKSKAVLASQDKPKESYLDTLKAGFRYFTKRPPLVLLCLIGVGYNLLLSPQNQLQTAYVVDTLHLDAYALSVIGVASSIGMLIGSMLYPLLKARFNLSKTIVLCGVCLTFHYVTFVLLSLLAGMEWFKYGVLFLAGCVMPMSISFFNLMTNVLFFRVIDEGYLSRMASIFNALGMVGIPLSSLYCGTLVSLMPITSVYLVSAALVLVSSLLVPKLKAMNALEALMVLKQPETPETAEALLTDSDAPEL
ncbi:MAG: MFS transporter [Clostridia bacterium]